MIHDPVCGMEIKDTSKAEKSEYKGKTYYFCTPLCKVQFEQEPEKYLEDGDNTDHNHEHHH